MNEVISGIRVIKMYGWEKPFASLVNEVRRYIHFCSVPANLHRCHVKVDQTAKKKIAFLA